MTEILQITSKQRQMQANAAEELCRVQDKSQLKTQNMKFIIKKDRKILPCK